MLFEKASRLKLRFEHKGLCSVEDLWDLPLESLNSIFKQLNRQVKDSKEEDLLEKKTKEDEALELQLEVVRHVVAVRLAEQKAREQEAEKTVKKQRILGIIAEKQDASLRDLPIEELSKMVNDL